jgi:hypothetical protein
VVGDLEALAVLNVPQHLAAAVPQVAMSDGPHNCLRRVERCRNRSSSRCSQALTLVEASYANSSAGVA